MHTRGCAIDIVGDGQFSFRLADGSVVEDTSPAVSPVVGGADPLVDANVQLGLSITEETPVAGWEGESLRSVLPDAVTGVLYATKGPRWLEGHYDDVIAS